MFWIKNKKNCYYVKKTPRIRLFEQRVSCSLTLSISRGACRNPLLVCLHVFSRSSYSFSSFFLMHKAFDMYCFLAHRIEDAAKLQASDNPDMQKECENAHNLLRCCLSGFLGGLSAVLSVERDASRDICSDGF